MIVRGAFNPLFRAGLRKDFGEDFDRYEPEYKQFLKSGTINTPEIRASIITGLSRLFERGDGEPITYDDPRMGPVVQGVDKEFGGGFIISRKTVEDDQYNKANQAAKWLANAVNMTYEVRAAQFLDDFFTGSVFRSIDNVAFGSATHTLLNSAATVSNALTGAAAVGVSNTGVTAMMDLFMQFRDQNNDPIKVVPNKIVISNNAGDLHRAMLIFNNDAEPFTADNNMNVIKKRLNNVQIVISRFKSGANRNWWMVDDKHNDAWMYVRRAPEMDDTFDFDTDAAKYKVSTRFLVWGAFWWGWAGSQAT